MKHKLNVGLLFGGKSGEHEVSLQSAKSIYEALDKRKYNVVLLGIDKTGRWHRGTPANYLLNAANPKLIALNKNAPVVTAIATTAKTELMDVNSGKMARKIDVFFPITHGTFGEDGSLQGLLELLDAPYVGAGVLGSAVGMDKDVMKRLLRNAGLPIGNFVAATKSELSKKFLTDVIKELGFPIFVKPANLGSSVGISKAKNPRELRRALQAAFQYDTKILLEECIKGREIECAVLGNEHPRASIPGEVTPTHDFYSYTAKYIDEKGAALTIPAKLSKRTIREMQTLAVNVFTTLECSGMGRVDCFLKPNGKLVVNEINTLPGFTKISMYPKLWEASGLSYQKLLDRLLELAIEKHRGKKKLQRNFEA